MREFEQADPDALGEPGAEGCGQVGHLVERADPAAIDLCQHLLRAERLLAEFDEDLLEGGHGIDDGEVEQPKAGVGRRVEVSAHGSGSFQDGHRASR